MELKVYKERDLILEAFEVLSKHWEPSKLAGFWSACGFGEGDYLKVKDQIFAGETVESLAEKLKEFEKANPPIVKGKP